VLRQGHGGPTSSPFDSPRGAGTDERTATRAMPETRSRPAVRPALPWIRRRRVVGRAPRRSFLQGSPERPRRLRRHGMGTKRPGRRRSAGSSAQAEPRAGRAPERPHCPHSAGGPSGRRTRDRGHRSARRPAPESRAGSALWPVERGRVRVLARRSCTSVGRVESGAASATRQRAVGQTNGHPALPDRARNWAGRESRRRPRADPSGGR
jgi:hypothetical protein